MVFEQSDAGYRLADGTCHGDVGRDGDELLDGQFMTRQSFWLTGDYVCRILENRKPILTQGCWSAILLCSARCATQI